MASPELEAILAAIFDAEFAASHEKHAKETIRDELLKSQAERAEIPWERLKLAILSSRYSEYRRCRLAREMPNIPPPLRSE